MADRSYIARRTREMAKSAGLSTQQVRQILAQQIQAPGTTPELLSKGNQRKVANLLKKGSKVFVGEIRTPAQQRDIIQKQAYKERKAWGNNIEERNNNSLLKPLQNSRIASRLTLEDLSRPIARGNEYLAEQKDYEDTVGMTWEDYVNDPRYQTMNLNYDKAGVAAFFKGYVEDFADTVYPNWRGMGSPIEPYIGFDLGAWL
ncbi:MAG TPA: hypothetical protein K8V21_08440 [Weissella thailandensis]|uniref:hypothetical protein n=1 Tax=Weissella thailandensis TaxID=89061 RepID=UPI001DF61131|nr:hypothetical protein [Weissella thailandensis]HJG85393.1 hypothetical protein [Weissella thailandensis]